MMPRQQKRALSGMTAQERAQKNEALHYTHCTPLPLICNYVCTFLINLMQTFMFHLGLRLQRWSGLQVEAQLPASSSPIPPAPKVDFGFYAKIAESTIREIATGIQDKTMTPATGWLLLALTARIDRRRNRAELSVSEIENLTGLTRPTILKHTALLESLGILTVDRAQITPKRNAVNVYHLAGAMTVALWNGSQASSAHENHLTTPVKRVDGSFKRSKTNNNDVGVDVSSQPEEGDLPESHEHRDEKADEQRDGDSTPEVTVPAIALEIGIHIDDAKRLVAQRGEDMVERWCAYARDNATNRGGTIKRPAAFAVAKLRAGDTPPTPAPNAPAPALQTETETDPYPASFAQPADADIAPERERDIPEAARELWQAALWQLELQLDRSSFDSWLRGTTAVDLSQNRLTVQVRNEYTAKLLQHRLYRTVRRITCDVACAVGAGEGVELKFVTREAAGV